MVWETCPDCNGSRFVHNLRTTQYRERFEGTNVRKFHDGKAGYAVAPCKSCDYGMGNKRNGRVKVQKKCSACEGRGFRYIASGRSIGREVQESVSNREPEQGSKPKKQKRVEINYELEAIRHNVNTNAFVSYRCIYRRSCEHCGRLFEKNGLTKAYCDQCYICKAKRKEDAAAKKEADADDAETAAFIKKCKEDIKMLK